MPNIKGMSEGEVAALLAGAAVRQTGGGSTYIVPDDLDAVFVDTPWGGRGILMLPAPKIGCPMHPDDCPPPLPWVLGGRHFAGGRVFVPWAGTAGGRDGGGGALAGG